MKPLLKITLLALAPGLLWPATALALVSAPDALTVAVYDFSVTDKGAASFARKVTTFITADLSLDTNLVVLARADLSQALSEQAFGSSGLVNAAAAAKIGQLTGAKVLVAGQVIRTEGQHLVLVANIVGAETGRLFAARVEGAADRLMDLSSQLSQRIALTISAQATNLIAAKGETRSQRLSHILSGIKGKNRPVVSVTIHHRAESNRARSASGEGEFGALLLKAGFPVVDANSDRKPDLQITGIYEIDVEPRRGELYSCHGVVDLKVQDRRTGNILALDHQESNAMDITLAGASRAAQANAVDGLAERILPLLAQ